MPNDFGLTVQGLDSVNGTLDAMVDLGDEMSGHVVASDVEYAVYVEFGTRYMAANGALRASVTDTLGNLSSIVDDADDANEVTKLVAEDIAEGWREDVWVDTGKLRNSIRVEAQ